MKKLNFFAGLAAGVCLLSSSTIPVPVGADKAIGQEYDLKGLDPNESPVKPTLSLSRIKVPLNVAKDDSIQTIELTVNGAERKYGPIGIHIDYDERLTLIMQKNKCAIKGNALEDYTDSGTDQLRYGSHGFFFAADNYDNYGLDGVIFSFKLKIPQNANVGDKYAVSILYRSTENAKDLFTNRQQNKEGQLMQAWVFTNGIEHGYIEIIEDDPNYVPKPTTTTTTSTATTTSATIKTTTFTTTKAPKITTKIAELITTTSTKSPVTTTSATNTSAAYTTTTKKPSTTSSAAASATTQKSTITTVSTTAKATTTSKPIQQSARLGDPTGDGFIDAVDASNILADYARFSTNSGSPSADDYATSDVNKDGFIDAVDASTVLAYYAYLSADGTDSFEQFMSPANTTTTTAAIAAKTTSKITTITTAKTTTSTKKPVTTTKKGVFERTTTTTIAGEQPQVITEPPTESPYVIIEPPTTLPPILPYATMESPIIPIDDSEGCLDSGGLFY